MMWRIFCFLTLLMVIAAQSFAATDLDRLRDQAEAGVAKAQRALGARYELGRGVPQNYAQAVVWYRKAARQGVARAQVNLGVLYEEGKGVPKDYRRAFSLYQKAAVQGYGRGLNYLGMMYEKGLGVKKDINQAMILYKQGADAQYSKAMMNLGRLYEYGAPGVAKDPLKAIAWYRLARDLGYGRAASALKRVKIKSTSAEADKQSEIVPEKEHTEQTDTSDASQPREVIAPTKEKVPPQNSVVPGSAPPSKSPQVAIGEPPKKDEAVQPARLTKKKVVLPVEQTGGKEIAPRPQPKSVVIDQERSKSGENARPVFVLIVLVSVLLALAYALYRTRGWVRQRTCVPKDMEQLAKEMRVIRKRLEALQESMRKEA